MDHFKIRDVISILRGLFPQLGVNEIVDDLEGSIESLGINILYSDMFDLEESGNVVSGFARVNPNTKYPEIVINGNEPHFRQRFTMAHELGHIILHWKWLPKKKLDPNFAEITYRSDLHYTPEAKQREIEANEFASELLLPLSEISDLVERNPALHGALDFVKSSLAENYKISPTMTGIQIEKFRRYYDN